MNILKRTLAGLLIVFLAFGQVTSIPGTVDAVMGFSNLTTVGAIPYVSASGTLSQDSPGIHWDATNNRLGLGTATPTYALHVVGNAILNTSEYHDVDGFGGRILWNSTSSSFSIGHVGGAQVFMQRAAISPSVGIGPSNTSPTGTLHVYDATPTTGVTTLTVRAGAGQSSTNLLELKNAAGTTNFSVQSGGRVDTDSLMTFGGGATASDGTNFVVGTAGQYLFSASTQWSGSKDLGLTRSSAGLLKVTNGSSGDGNIIAGNFKRGTGDPNSVITGSVGDLFLRTDGGASTTLYVKESGSATNTGWVAK